ncbi:Helicase SWR1 [Cyberlindnera fabianii]|uniref:Helicase SWR1 n=1 Tax=Cyberlindnera fabianii TaxID=36022 RepID=A0A1V2LAL3_CYBFA|nr:Helicase SWR1 [Cyberlindnera fabianii]
MAKSSSPVELPAKRASTRLNSAAEDSLETPSKRRKSSRVHTPINYSQSTRRERHSSTEAPSEQHVVRKDGVTYIEDTEALRKHQDQVLGPIDTLGKLSAQHQLLTSELFHLKQFTSLATWDPEATHSSFYDDFVEEKYDLWKIASDDKGSASNGARRSRGSRHSSRATANPLRPRVEDSRTKFLDEVLNPSKFYSDQFLIEKSTRSSRKPKPMIIQPSSSSTLNKSVKVEGNQKSIPPETKEKSSSKKSSKPTTNGRSRSVKPQEAKDSDDDSDFDTANESEADGSEDESESDIDVPVLFPEGEVPKLKIKLSLPKPTITNPSHVAVPEFPSLGAYLDSFRSLDEDMTLEEYDAYINENRELIAKLKRAVDNDVLTVDDEFNITKVPPPQPYRDPLKNQHTHQEHLVGQAVHLSKLMHDSKKARIQRARKVSLMIESHFKRLAGAEERKRKEEERRVKGLARNAIQAVKKRWTLAEKAFRILKKQETEELKRIKGKEHLSQMLEHSTQLLEQQLTKQSDEEDEDENMSDGESDMELLTDGLDSEGLQNIDDSKLSVEQLKLKYAQLQGMNFDDVSEATGTERETTGVEETEAETEQEETQTDQTPIELTEKEREVVDAENQKHNSLLDSDSSMDSDSGSEEESSEEEESDDEPKRSSGLAAFFGATAQTVDDEDEDGGYSDESSADEHADEEPDDEDEDDAKETPAPEDKTSRATSEVTEHGVVDVPVPDLILRGNLRYYQKQGLNWLASLYNNHTNGILADEMGLGKTIQTISLLSYLAVFKGVWGPHLIVVPTSVLLNWEMEFKKFAPGFKLMVYYGSPQQRKEKRKGWNKPDTFHVCITSYQLVCQDQQIFKRKRWRYMILDEAHNIKNFKSNRWNALLNFNTENRLLLTGTPLQNNIMELWSLLYFLMPSSKADQSMPSGFANLDDFQQWFGKPVDKIIEGSQEVDEESKKTVAKLHQVLRPYLLRRLKADVESQMPGKYEHVVYCRLSKRQYKLYHEYLARSDTKDMLRNANYISIINCLMQLRKVCNHPDLFEERPIMTSFAVSKSVVTPYEVTSNLVLRLTNEKKRDTCIDLDVLNLNFTTFDQTGLNTSHCDSIEKIKSSSVLVEQVKKLSAEVTDSVPPNYTNMKQFYDYTTFNQKQELLGQLQRALYLNNLRCAKKPMYGTNVINMLKVCEPVKIQTTLGQDLIKPLETRILDMNDEIERFAFVTPPVVTLNMKNLSVSKELANEVNSTGALIENPFHQMQTKLSIQFPDKSLLLYDCGKLQKLAKLLQDLKDGGHRALIFTQMTKVLDILEQFLNIMGIRYMRLDGATKIEDRQILTEKFNSDPKIMVFILSTRSGGLGINLTGADTVIFYDSDWNPAMDKQCQDRCHRIGQTRDVHIYRFVSEYTIESNILKKANQKRHLDNVVIQEGEFTTDYFSKLSVKDLLGDEGGDDLDDSKPLFGDTKNLNSVLAQAEDDADAKAAKEAMKETDENLDQEDFDDNNDGEKKTEDEFGVDDEGVGHIDEYMIRYIANGYYYD